MKKQTGMTFIGMLSTVAIIVVVGVLIMRVVPVYLQYYAVKQSVHALNKQPSDSMGGSPLTHIANMKDRLKKQFSVDGVEIPENQISIKPLQDNEYEVKVVYTEKRALIGSMSLLFEFDITEEVQFD
tara:strand:- start:2827 stop:3207 length:381 start_codon:yes stop_codon:yes gene_type:complete